jgi:hypothetical protein
MELQTRKGTFGADDQLVRLPIYISDPAGAQQPAATGERHVGTTTRPGSPVFFCQHPVVCHGLSRLLGLHRGIEGFDVTNIH